MSASYCVLWAKTVASNSLCKHGSHKNRKFVSFAKDSNCLCALEKTGEKKLLAKLRSCQILSNLYFSVSLWFPVILPSLSRHDCLLELCGLIYFILMVPECGSAYSNILFWNYQKHIFRQISHVLKVYRNDIHVIYYSQQKTHLQLYGKWEQCILLKTNCLRRTVMCVFAFKI